MWLQPLAHLNGNECVTLRDAIIITRSPRKTKKARWPLGHRAGRWYRAHEMIAYSNGLVLPEFASTGFHLMDLRQYSEFGQAHGICGWYNR